MSLKTLSQTERNALRSKAKSCSDELKRVTKNQKSFDKMSRPIIAKYHSEIKALCSLIEFIYVIGVMNGQFKEWE